MIAFAVGVAPRTGVGELPPGSLSERSIVPVSCDWNAVGVATLMVTFWLVDPARKVTLPFWVVKPPTGGLAASATADQFIVVAVVVGALRVIWNVTGVVAAPAVWVTLYVGALKLIFGASTTVMLMSG